ncbi:MAG: DUF4339 domain-containing protein [Deltaproteobacteria bacterium]|nr:DUF4339 domain-containing protein [Deltaproteobacteria bacterium]
MRTYKLNVYGVYVLQLFSAVFILMLPTLCIATESTNQSPESDTDSVSTDSDTVLSDSDSIDLSDSDSVVSSPPPQEIMWYAYMNGSKLGPFAQTKMEEMVANGIITHYTQVNRVGTAQWVEAQTVFTFATEPRPAAVEARMPVSEIQSVPGRPQPAPSAPRVNDEYLYIKASHVKSANAVAAIGMLGSAAGMALQIAGISAENEDRFLAGMGVSIGFGVLRFIGVVASGVAARRYTRLSGKPLFSFGAFWGGFFVGIAGSVMQYALGAENVNAQIGIGVGTELIRDIFWIVHCANAAGTTMAHRTRAATHTPRFAMVPMVNPRVSSYGLGLQMSY